MGLLRNIETPQGVVADYHKLIKVEVDCRNKNIQMIFAIYLNENCEKSGNSPLWHEYVNVPFEEFKEDPRTLFYNTSKNFKNSYLANSNNSSLISNDLNLIETLKLNE